MVIDRRDIRVLADGWYEFRIESVREVDTCYGPGVDFGVVVCRGRAEGARMVIRVDRVATPGNKTGRLISAVGFDSSIELPLDTVALVGRRFAGRVTRYVRVGRVRAKVAEFAAAERLEEKVEDFARCGGRSEGGGV